MTDLLSGLYKSKLELLNLPYDLQISTTTITCHLDITFNVENIGLYFNDFDDIIVGKRYGNRIVNNLVNVKKLKIGKKKKRKEKKNFYNQVSLIFRSATLMGLDPDKLSIKEKFKTVNIKLFINGSIQMTGCKHLDNIQKTLEILFDRLKIRKAILDKNDNFIIKSFVCNSISNKNVDDNTIAKLDVKNVDNFKIVMINTNFNILFQINRERLYQLLKDEGFDVIFDPITHACVNIKYQMSNNPKKTISIFVFESGSITIAGSNSYHQVLETYNFINKFILSNYDKLLTKNITPQLIIQLIQNMH
jgi:TATA-box binding protein (TBP) (component of TFIID and TFIIIB)